MKRPVVKLPPKTIFSPQGTTNNQKIIWSLNIFEQILVDREIPVQLCFAAVHVISHTSTQPYSILHDTQTNTRVFNHQSTKCIKNSIPGSLLTKMISILSSTHNTWLIVTHTRTMPLLLLAQSDQKMGRKTIFQRTMSWDRIYTFSLVIFISVAVIWNSENAASCEGSFKVCLSKKWGIQVVNKKTSKFKRI